MAKQNELTELSKDIVSGLNGRSGISIDFDDETMEDIYNEISWKISQGVSEILKNHLGVQE